MSDAFVQRLSTVVVVVCLLTVAGTSALLVSPTLRGWVGVGPGAAPPDYVVGDRIDVASALYQSAPVTVVVFARSTCPACQKSADFHRQVSTTAGAIGVPVRLVTPSPELAAEQAYASGLGIASERVHVVSSGSIRLRAVPALMVVDSAGTIQHVWFGAPDAAVQATILQTLHSLEGARRP